MKQENFEVGKFYVYNNKIFLILTTDVPYPGFYKILLLEKSTEKQKFIDYFLSGSIWAERSFPLKLK
jgi:hypothetical protein